MHYLTHSLVAAFMLLAYIRCAAQPLTALSDMNSDNTSKYSCIGHSKSKGAAFTMKYPRSWEVREGEHPNVVNRILFTHDYDHITVVIITRVIPAKHVLTREEIERHLSPDRMKASLPDDAQYHGAEKTKIEGEPAGIVEYSILTERAGNKVSSHVFALWFFQGNTMIQIQFSVATTMPYAAMLEHRAVAWQPAFRKMMNSIIFPDKWK